jgi:hypothetical protein
MVPVSEEVYVAIGADSVKFWLTKSATRVDDADESLISVADAALEQAFINKVRTIGRAKIIFFICVLVILMCIKMMEFL